MFLYFESDILIFNINNDNKINNKINNKIFKNNELKNKIKHIIQSTNYFLRLPHLCPSYSLHGSILTLP